jgi:hypothetical protein
MQNLQFKYYVKQDGLVQFQLPEDVREQLVDFIVITQSSVQHAIPTEQNVDWAHQLIKAQQLVMQYIPAEQDLVAELLDDRQQALHDESRIIYAIADKYY